MPKNNIMEKDNHLAMFDHGPKEFGRIPQNSKQRIFLIHKQRMKGTSIDMIRTEVGNSFRRLYNVTRAPSINVLISVLIPQLYMVYLHYILSNNKICFLRSYEN